MKVVNYEIEIIDDNCTGCYACERVCPTEAITMVGQKKDALAVVDNDQCIACFQCIDSCDDDAMFARRRDVPLILETTIDGEQGEAIVAMCQQAELDPESGACFCTGTQVKEVAAAILNGASSFEDLAMGTGAQAGCLMYCSVPIRRLLDAHLGEVVSTSKVRRYGIDLALSQIPEDVADRYPIFNVRQEQQNLREHLENANTDL